MPLGILTEEEFKLEITKANSNGNNRKKSEAVVIVERGRGDKAETPESARKLIAELAISGESNADIAREFNISPSSISAYKHGATSTATYDQPEKELTKHNNLVRDRIIRKSRKKLVLALDKITDDKLDNLDAKGCASIAKDMSTVIRNLEPEIKPETNLNAQFIFYAPQVKKEIDYPIIDVDN